MQALKLISTLIMACGFFYLAGCASNQSSSESADVYASLKNDEIAYRQEPNAAEEEQTFIKELTAEVRNLYLHQDYEEAEAQAERLLRINSNAAEPYYWLARIKLALHNYQQAYNLTSQGLNYSTNTGMTRELEHLQRQAQMGAN